jgi:Uncharacterised methyltransferase family (DUF6094)
MRSAGRLILGFYPLPLDEALRLRQHLSFPVGKFSAIDPCVGDGVAFETLLEGSQSRRYGIEIDALRSQQAQDRNIQVIRGDALEVRCPADSLSLLYLNPPYDFEVGAEGNKRFEELFLRHTFRWLKRSGVLVFVIPQRQLDRCSSLLAEHFLDIRVFRLTSAASVQYGQVGVLAVRRSARQTQTDRQHRAMVEHLNGLAHAVELPSLTEIPESRYQVPLSGPSEFTNRGFPLDAIEDLMVKSSAYTQAARLLTRQPAVLRGRPITQLHGGHVALLAASGALNGVFGQGPDRHMANWSAARMYHHSSQEEEDGTIISRNWSSFSPKLLLLYEDGRTQVLAHKKLTAATADDGQHEIATRVTSGPRSVDTKESSEGAVAKPRRTSRRRISLR